MIQPKAGLLPLYLSLYDRLLPEMRQTLEPFLETVAAGLAAEGLEMIRVPICRTRDEVAAAVRTIEHAGADAIVTLHLAYSPSLESADVLAESALPIVMCDTTPDHDFGAGVAFDRMLYNHGIHGLQDLASVLRRRGKTYAIAAGHASDSPVLTRTADFCRAAVAATRLGTTKALRIGATFEGMGDFAVDDSELFQSVGIHVTQIDASDLIAFGNATDEQAIDVEVERDRSLYDVTASTEVHRRSVRVGLAVRAALEQGGYGAFSANFLAFDTPEPPVNVVPFLEASKAMARGIGYAGEGDVLTASLVGALAGAFGQTSFVEVFSPDWKGQSLWISHMGEISPSVAGERAVISEKPYAFTRALNPAILTCAPKAGPGVLVNLAPGPGGSFGVIVSEVHSLGDSHDATMRQQVRGWLKPSLRLGQWLENYSLHGGTHHQALVMGVSAETIEVMARFAGLACVRI